MSKHISTQSKTINIALVIEELKTALGKKFSFTPGGYQPEPGNRLWLPRTEPFVVSKSKTPTGYVTETAQPGELWVRIEEALTPGEIVSIEGVFSAHDAAKKTAFQTLVDVNETAYDQLAVSKFSTEPDKAKQNAMIDAIQRFVLFETKRNPTWLKS